jgi:prolyl-tRNA editing enzyme YbaK/EbsC (Cys-tRNA(Pro) deacylase)
MSTLRAGQPDAADGIRILPAEARTAAQAAEPLGVEAGTIANSLTFRAVFLDRVEPLR